MAVDASTMRAMVPKVPGPKGQSQASIIAGVGAVLSPTLAAYQINSALRIAHFLAQCAQESDSFCTTVEYASGQAYEHRTDLGNTQPGDGPRYKGRGLIQLTGRKNYGIYGQALGLPLEANPDMAAQPVLSLTIACEYWKLNNINALADRDDVQAVTRAVNGGLLGLDQRTAFLAKAKSVLANTAPPLVVAGSGSAGGAQSDPVVAPSGVGAGAGNVAPAAAGNTGTPAASGSGGGNSGGGAPLDLAAVAAGGNAVLRRGATGNDVARLQAFLTAKGFPVSPDGKFGDDTEKAVIQFQQASGLKGDGVVGADTWDMLEA